MNMLWYFLVVLGQIGIIFGLAAAFFLLIYFVCAGFDEDSPKMLWSALLAIFLLGALCLAFLGTLMTALDEVRIRHKDSYNECIEERRIDGNVDDYAYEHCLEDNEGISY